MYNAGSRLLIHVEQLRNGYRCIFQEPVVWYTELCCRLGWFVLFLELFYHVASALRQEYYCCGQYVKMNRLKIKCFVSSVIALSPILFPELQTLDEMKFMRRLRQKQTSQNHSAYCGKTEKRVNIGAVVNLIHISYDLSAFLTAVVDSCPNFDVMKPALE